MTRPALRLAAGLALLLALAGAAPLAAQTRSAGGDPLLTRVFEVRYRSLPVAADLVGSVLSAEGSVTLKPQQRLLVVSDRAAVLVRVQSLIESYDLPPRTIVVDLHLYLGTKRAEQENPALAPRGLIDLIPLQFTKWTSYESLGSRSVNGVEGDEVIAHLSNDYRVVLIVEEVDERHRVVKFKGVRLQRVDRPVGGAERLADLYSASAVVDADKQYIFGAAAGPDAERALFLTLRAQLR